MRYNQQLDDLFKNLGFLNFKEFLNTACALRSKSNSGTIYTLNDLYSDEQGIGYYFKVQHEAKTAKWNIRSIKADFQMLTERNREGVIIIEKKYHSDTSALPSKELIKNEILRMVKLEKNNERLYLLKNGQNTVYRTFRNPVEYDNLSIYDLIGTNGSLLEKEVSKLGFNYRDVQITFHIDKRRPPEIFLIECRDNLPFPIDGLSVQFKINKLTLDKSLYIEAMEAGFFKTTPSNIIVEKSYLPLSGSFPTKEKIYSDLIDEYRMLKTRERFNFNMHSSNDKNITQNINSKNPSRKL